MLKLARLFAMPEPDAGEVAVVMEKWAGADLPAALEWAATVAPGVVRDEVMASVVRVWSRTDPVAAADLLRTQIADSNVLHQCIQHLAATWGAVDLRAVRAWAKSLPDSQAAAARRGATEASSASKYTRPSRP